MYQSASRLLTWTNSRLSDNFLCVFILFTVNLDEKSLKCGKIYGLRNSVGKRNFIASQVTLLAFMTIDVYEHTSMPLTSCSEENTIMLLNIRGLKNIKKILIAQGGE